MNDKATSQTTPCPHGIMAPVVCPQCRPDVYAKALPQAERHLTAKEQEIMHRALRRSVRIIDNG